MAVLTVLHHRWKHHHDLKGWKKYFQLKDVDNHETLVILLLGLAAGRALSMYM